MSVRLYVRVPACRRAGAHAGMRVYTYARGRQAEAGRQRQAEAGRQAAAGGSQAARGSQRGENTLKKLWYAGGGPKKVIILRGVFNKWPK